MTKKKNIAIVGAGLVGSLLSIYLSKRGYKVTMLEKRPDMRKQQVDGGRSINLALSNRGLRPLEEMGLAEPIKKLAIPMHGRMIHTLDGKVNFQPYGKKGQFINSISRSELNMMLMTEAEKNKVEILFSQTCSDLDFENTSISTEDGPGKETKLNFDLIIGADGAPSAVRSAMKKFERFNYWQHHLEHGYKELNIPAGKDKSFLMEKNTLHIWPRDSFMLIALPNPEGNFTVTLFYPHTGERSFETLKSDQDVRRFFETQFPDALQFMPALLDDFSTNPTSSLTTIQCFPWIKNNVFLIGDAAHGIVPFYGQGMNAGFEDCYVLNQLLNKYQDDWEKVLPEYQQLRKPDADAIGRLALDNFIEMRDLVADEKFVLRKKIEAKLHELFPEKWIPLYSMVTFREDIRYSEALTIGTMQKRIMDKVMTQPDIFKNWEQLDFKSIVDQLKQTTSPIK